MNTTHIQILYEALQKNDITLEIDNNTIADPDGNPIHYNGVYVTLNGFILSD